MGWGPDKDGVNGVYLRKDVPLQVSGDSRRPALSTPRPWPPFPSQDQWGHRLGEAMQPCSAQPQPTQLGHAVLPALPVRPPQAAKALEICLRTIAPKILTWSQYAEAAYNMFEKNVMGRSVGEYQPNFTQCVDHFALHAGGYAVLKGLQQAMQLPSEKMMPSFATLRDYGNTSCSTTWYVMAYMESVQGMKRNQSIMQIGMGGGMKAGVNVWRALRDVKNTHGAWRHLEGKPVTEADLPRPIDDPTCRMAGTDAVAHGQAVEVEGH